MRLAVTLLLSGLGGAGAMADPVTEILESAAADCVALNGTGFDAQDSVQEVDLDGDGVPDQLVDTARFACDGVPGLYCGSGGCALHAVIGERVWDFQSEDWRMIDWNGRPILLIARDGGWCGAAGAQVCYEAVVWSAGEMLSVMPAP